MIPAFCNAIEKKMNLIPEITQKLLGFLYINDLPAFVGSGFGVDTVRLASFTGIFVEIKLRHRQSVMSATLASPRFGMSSFWIRHILNLFLESTF
jgi:hypothetical protein